MVAFEEASFELPSRSSGPTVVAAFALATVTFCAFGHVVDAAADCALPRRSVRRLYFGTFFTRAEAARRDPAPTGSRSSPTPCPCPSPIKLLQPAGGRAPGARHGPRRPGPAGRSPAPSSRSAGCVTSDCCAAGSTCLTWRGTAAAGHRRAVARASNFLGSSRAVPHRVHQPAPTSSNAAASAVTVCMALSPRSAACSLVSASASMVARSSWAWCGSRSACSASVRKARRG
jgi:hypothetical protein